MALTRPRAYQIYDIDYKQAVRVVTTTNITLLGGAPVTVDGISLLANDRILVTGQTIGSNNGIYYVSVVGTGSDGVWERSTDTNATGELLSGTIVMVTEGNVYKDTQWKLTTDDPITIGTSDLIFVQNYSTNSISAGTSNVVVTSNSAVTISAEGSPNVLTITSGEVGVAGHIIPTANVTYTLGNATNRFKDIWLANSTIYLGNVALSASTTDLLINGTNVITETGGALSVTGNITGDYIIGNGSQLTGLPAGYANSDVALYLASGDDTANIITTGNVSGTYILGNGSQLSGLPEQYGNSNVSAYLASGDDTANIITTGNVSGNYFIGNGSQLTGLPEQYGNSNVSAYLASGDNTANIVTTGNVAGNYFVGNGAALTGIISGGTISFSNTAPVTARAGDVWIQANTAVQYVYFDDGTSNQWAEMEAYQSFSGGGGAGTPGGANTQVQFNDADSFGATANLTFDKTTNTLTTVAVSATGNITGSYFIGNGSQLTGIAMSWSIANSNATMSVNRGYFVDTSGGAKTMTLPASAVIGDTVRINDLAGTFGTNNLTVGRNGGNIQGVAEDLSVTVNQSSFGLVYSNSTYGWKLLEF